MPDKDPVFILCDQIREAAYALHQFLGPGHLEKIYRNGLLNRLRKQGLVVTERHELSVLDEDGTVLGCLQTDLYFEFPLIIEIKAAKTIADEHIAQLLGYLRASRVQHGLLINFGAPRLQIRKFVYSQIQPVSD